MEIQLFEGDFLNLEKHGLHILSKDILSYIDENRISAEVVIRGLQRVMVIELFNMNMASMLIDFDGNKKKFTAPIPNSEIDIIREYKVININEHIDNNGIHFSFVEMVRIERSFSENWDGDITWMNLFSLGNSDTFIFPSESTVLEYIENNPEENKYIEFSDYEQINIVFDGKARKVFKYVKNEEITNDSLVQKLILKSANGGENFDEFVLYKFLSDLNGYSIELAESRVVVFNEKEIVIDSPLRKVEEDAFSTTYIGKFKTGLEFRLLTLGEIPMNVIKSKNERPFIIFGSLHLKGYAVTFEMA